MELWVFKFQNHKTKKCVIIFFPFSFSSVDSSVETTPTKATPTKTTPTKTKQGISLYFFSFKGLRPHIIALIQTVLAN